jgi:hypothetical protein
MRSPLRVPFDPSVLLAPFRKLSLSQPLVPVRSCPSYLL